MTGFYKTKNYTVTLIFQSFKTHMHEQCADTHVHAHTQSLALSVATLKRRQARAWKHAHLLNLVHAQLKMAEALLF